MAKRIDINAKLTDVLLKTVGMSPAGVTRVGYAKEVGGHGVVTVEGAQYDMLTKTNIAYTRRFELSDNKGVRELE